MLCCLQCTREREYVEINKYVMKSQCLSRSNVETHRRPQWIAYNYRTFVVRPFYEHRLLLFFLERREHRHPTLCRCELLKSYRASRTAQPKSSRWGGNRGHRDAGIPFPKAQRSLNTQRFILLYWQWIPEARWHLSRASCDILKNLLTIIWFA